MLEPLAQVPIRQCRLPNEDLRYQGAGRAISAVVVEVVVEFEGIDDRGEESSSNRRPLVQQLTGDAAGVHPAELIVVLEFDTQKSDDRFGALVICSDEQGSTRDVGRRDIHQGAVRVAGGPAADGPEMVLSRHNFLNHARWDRPRRATAATDQDLTRRLEGQTGIDDLDCHRHKPVGEVEAATGKGDGDG